MKNINKIVFNLGWTKKSGIAVSKSDWFEIHIHFYCGCTVHTHTHIHRPECDNHFFSFCIFFISQCSDVLCCMQDCPDVLKPRHAIIKRWRWRQNKKMCTQHIFGLNAKQSEATYNEPVFSVRFMCISFVVVLRKKERRMEMERQPTLQDKQTDVYDSLIWTQFQSNVLIPLLNL